MIKNKYLKTFSFIALGAVLFSACTKRAVEEQKSQTPAPTQTAAPVIAKTPSYYYTANESGSISKIDVETNKVVDTFKTDGNTHNVQVSPDGKILGATVAVPMEKKTEHGTMNMKGSALFYDTETNKLINKVEVGEHPAHIVFTPDGKYAVVTNNENNNLFVIDTQTYKVVNQVTTGKGPHGFRISPDGKFAYVANMGEDTISVIDLVNFTETSRIKVGKTPVTTGITSDGKTLVATVNDEDALAVIDIATGNINKIAVGKGPAQVYIQSDNKYAFVANQGTEESPSNTVSKVDLSTKTVVATIQAGKGAHGVVTSDDNKYVYITNMYEGTVSVIDNATDKVIATVNVEKEPNGISFKK
jgi:YVTN family beta-propeller protein